MRPARDGGLGVNAPTPDAWAILDGVRVRAAEASLPITDPLTTHGMGLFETLVCRERRVFDLPAHLDRLSASAVAWGIDPLREAWREALLSLASEFEGPAWLRLTLSASGRWFVLASPLDPDPAGRPVRVVTLPWTRARAALMAGCKSTSYAENMRGHDWARERGADTGLWLNDRGHVVETCTANLVVLRGKRVTTPALSEGCLPGTVRARLLEVAKERGFVVHEQRVRPQTLVRADAIWVTSSLGGIRPVISVDGAALRSEPTSEAPKSDSRHGQLIPGDTRLDGDRRDDALPGGMVHGDGPRGEGPPGGRLRADELPTDELPTDGPRGEADRHVAAEASGCRRSPNSRRSHDRFARYTALAEAVEARRREEGIDALVP